MEPKTLEEALEVIKQKDTQIADITKQRDTAVEDKKKVLGEKKDLLKMFDEKDKEGMTETERKLAETLETERAERLKLEEQLKTDAETKNKAEADRVAKAIEDRIVKVSKGDTKVADQLRANVALLEKMPRASDSDFDAVITSAWNMRGTQEPAPLGEINNTSGGDTKITDKPNFADTDTGKKVADKLGLSVEPAKGEQK